MWARVLGNVKNIGDVKVEGRGLGVARGEREIWEKQRDEKQKQISFEIAIMKFNSLHYNKICTKIKIFKSCSQIRKM